MFVMCMTYLFCSSEKRKACLNKRVLCECRHLGVLLVLLRLNYVAIQDGFLHAQSSQSAEIKGFLVLLWPTLEVAEGGGSVMFCL